MAMLAAKICSLLCLGIAVASQGADQSQSYNASEAQDFAAFASLPYCWDLAWLQDWKCTNCKASGMSFAPGQIRVIDGDISDSARAIVWKLADQRGCLVSFRGAANVMNFVRAFEFWTANPTEFPHCAGCSVEQGMYSMWLSMQDAIVNALREVGCAPGGEDGLVQLTGHSMGGALAQLGMFALPSFGFSVGKSYSFESPRVGNKAFAQAVTALGHYRVTHNADPVVHLPFQAMGFVHAQTEIFYDAAGKFKVCGEVEDGSCANQYWNLASMLWYSVGDHCGSPMVPTGNLCDPGCYPAPPPPASALEQPEILV